LDTLYKIEDMHIWWAMKTGPYLDVYNS